LTGAPHIAPTTCCGPFCKPVMARYGLQGHALNMASIANALKSSCNCFGPCLDVADDDVYCLIGSHPVRDVSAAHEYEGAHILRGVYRSHANSLKKVTASQPLPCNEAA
jgi:hypothetical protein